MSLSLRSVRLTCHKTLLMLELRYDKTDNERATLLQNEFNSDIARFTTHESNLSCNKSACCRLRKVVAESRE